jgi:hypothetical protein
MQGSSRPCASSRARACLVRRAPPHASRGPAPTPEARPRVDCGQLAGRGESLGSAGSRRRAGPGQRGAQPPGQPTISSCGRRSRPSVERARRSCHARTFQGGDVHRPASQRFVNQLTDARAARARGITPILGARVRDVTDGRIAVADGRALEAGTVIWTAGVRGSSLGATLGRELVRRQGGPVPPSVPPTPFGLCTHAPFQGSLQGATTTLAKQQPAAGRDDAPQAPSPAMGRPPNTAPPVRPVPRGALASACGRSPRATRPRLRPAFARPEHG